MSVHLLFTSVGRRVELLRAFRRVYERLGVSGRIVAVDVDPLAPALRVADAPYIVPRLDSPEYIPALQAILDRERITAVFPLIDPDIPVLARNRESLESTGARLAVVSPWAAEVTADKWQTTRWFEEISLPAPRSWLPEETREANLSFPLFIKPRRGSASQQIFKVETSRQLEFFAEYVSDPIIQEYLGGPEITTDVLCDLDGALLGIVSRQRIRTQAGEVLIGETVRDQAILDGCERIAQMLPAVGPITVQCIMNHGVPIFTEINARFGGGAPLGFAAGADGPAWLLSRLANLPCDLPPLGSYRIGLYLSRYHESFFIDEAEHEAMASRRL